MHIILVPVGNLSNRVFWNFWEDCMLQRFDCLPATEQLRHKFVHLKLTYYSPSVLFIEQWSRESLEKTLSEQVLDFP